ncbi:uncharacterized protein LOC129759102 [Uranotaenia lowii]|uniref:uncharacterized protein LOC129759102 n=1 Tax=Uranotaenia lowii TaxID=190385 RepID=UPI00247AD703|nr:uncharacterized protein LOC129759102 [Uranotaenia lowii]
MLSSAVLGQLIWSTFLIGMVISGDQQWPNEKVDCATREIRCRLLEWDNVQPQKTEKHLLVAGPLNVSVIQISQNVMDCMILAATRLNVIDFDAPFYRRSNRMAVLQIEDCLPLGIFNVVSDQLIPKITSLEPDDAAIEWPPHFKSMEQLSFQNILALNVSMSELNEYDKLIRFHAINVGLHLNDSKTPVTLRSLRIIELQSCALRKIDFSHWSLPELRELTFDQNLFTELPLIKHFKRLEMLKITNALIQSVNMDSFEGLSHLKTIDLTGNQILTVSLNRVITLPALNVLRLQINRIETFPPPNLLKMPRLTEIVLFRNGLSNLELSHWDKLKIIYFSQNPLDCSWLKKNGGKLESKLEYYESIVRAACYQPIFMRFALKPIQ